MNKLIITSLILFFSIKCFAGKGWYVTINNNTNAELTFTTTGVFNWWQRYRLVFADPISARSSNTFYTEEEAKTWWCENKHAQNFIWLNNQKVGYIEFKYDCDADRRYVKVMIQDNKDDTLKEIYYGAVADSDNPKYTLDVSRLCLYKNGSKYVSNLVQCAVSK